MRDHDEWRNFRKSDIFLEEYIQKFSIKDTEKNIYNETGEWDDDFIKAELDRQNKII